MKTVQVILRCSLKTCKTGIDGVKDVSVGCGVYNDFQFLEDGFWDVESPQACNL